MMIYHDTQILTGQLRQLGDHLVVIGKKREDGHFTVWECILMDINGHVRQHNYGRMAINYMKLVTEAENG